MSKRCELQKEYYQKHGNYKGNGKYNDKYVDWLENMVLEYRQRPDRKSVCCDSELVNFNNNYYQCFVCGKIEAK